MWRSRSVAAECGDVDLVDEKLEEAAVSSFRSGWRWE